MAKGKRFSPEFRWEAVRLYKVSARPFREIAGELGIAPESLRRWVRQAEIDGSRRDGLTCEEPDARLLRRRTSVVLVAYAPARRCGLRGLNVDPTYHEFGVFVAIVVFHALVGAALGNAWAIALPLLLIPLSLPAGRAGGDLPAEPARRSTIHVERPARAPVRGGGR